MLEALMSSCEHAGCCWSPSGSPKSSQGVGGTTRTEPCAGNSSAKRAMLQIAFKGYQECMWSENGAKHSQSMGPAFTEQTEQPRLQHFLGCLTDLAKVHLDASNTHVPSSANLQCRWYLYLCRCRSQLTNGGSKMLCMLTHQGSRLLVYALVRFRHGWLV